MKTIDTSNGAANRMPFVNVVSNPEMSTSDNPNGIGLASNMIINGRSADMMIIQMLSEAIRLVAMRAAATGKLSQNIVLPDGSAAPLPDGDLNAAAPQ